MNHTSVSGGSNRLVLPSLLCSNMGVIEPHEFISGWFLGTPLASITLEDLKEFLAFGLYHRDLHELPEDTQAAVAGEK